MPRGSTICSANKGSVTEATPTGVTGSRKQRRGNGDEERLRGQWTHSEHRCCPRAPTLTQAGSTVQKAREIRCSLLRRQACGPVRPGKYAATGRSCCCCCRSFFGCSCFRRRDSLYATGCHQFFVVVIFRCVSAPKPSTNFFSAGVVPGELGDTPPLFRDIPASPLRDFRVSACALSRRVPSSHYAC
jgi:hypothetical protein